MRKFKSVLSISVLMFVLAVPALADGGIELPGAKPCTANCGRTAELSTVEILVVKGVMSIVSLF